MRHLLPLQRSRCAPCVRCRCSVSPQLLLLLLKPSAANPLTPVRSPTVALPARNAGERAWQLCDLRMQLDEGI